MVTLVPARLVGRGKASAWMPLVDAARFLPKMEIIEPGATAVPGAAAGRKLAPFTAPPSRTKGA